MLVALAHIFFDDAFELSDHDENESQVNRFVKLLVGTLDEAASDVHQTRMHVRAPKKYPTPYGGRLVWTLPGKTKMIAHLKDKSKIRHRKRWSQVRVKNSGKFVSAEQMLFAFARERRTFVPGYVHVLFAGAPIDGAAN